MASRISISAAMLLVLALDARAQSTFVNWESPHVSPLALTPSGQMLLAVNTADNRLEVFDVSSGVPRRVRSIPVGLDPVSVRARSNSEAWVVNHISDSISIVDLTSGRVVRTLLTGDEPADVVFAGSPQRAFVSISQLNQLQVFDPANLAAPPNVVPIQGEDPRALAVSAAGDRVFAAIFESGNRTTILSRQTVSNPNGPYGGQNPPPNSGNVFSPPRTPGLPPAPGVAQIVRQNAAGEWRDDNGRNWSAQVNWGVHDHDVAMIDAQTLAVTYATDLMTTLAALSVSPTGEVTAVGTEALNQMRFEPRVDAIFIRAQVAFFDPTNVADRFRTDLNPHLTYAQTTIPPAMRSLSIGDPRGMVWHPSGELAYISGMGSNNVIMIDPDGSRVGEINVGQGPTGLAIAADGSRLFVLNKFDASISTIDTSANAEVGRLSFFDPTPTGIKDGRPFLYDTHLTSGLGQVSCASCHIDGRTDHLAWDLGNPAGQMKGFNQTCFVPNQCNAWHPMKGPMVTQTLEGIIGQEPFHWRGDRENLAAFDVAFTSLMGADLPPTPDEMQKLTNMVAGLRFPPNPNRNLDGSLRTSLATFTGTGNAQNGENLFLTAPIVANRPCASCHQLPSGTSRVVHQPLGPEPQNIKMAQLRNMYDKAGANRASLSANRGFGFNHDGAELTLNELMSVPAFNFPPGPPGAQQRRDVEAYLLSFSVDTHPAIGRQVTFDGANNSNANLNGVLNTLISLADGGQIGLVVKGRQLGIDRGYRYNGGGVLQSDRNGEQITAAALRIAASGGNELTWTAVPVGTQTRIGIDRDLDGHFDRDEIEGCGDPANPAIGPGGISPCDANCDGSVNGFDINGFVDLISSQSIQRCSACAGDTNGDGSTNLFDIDGFVGCLSNP